MERSARTIGRDKFCRQPAPRRHKLLAALAREHAGDGDLDAFSARYDEMMAWSTLDRYHPPAWLSPREALAEYARFHEILSGKQRQFDPVEPPAQVTSWQPRFPVTVVLDQVRTPHNCGSVLRLIDNFGFEGLVHATAHFDPEHNQLHRAARGSEKWVPITCVTDLPGWLAEQTRPVIGLEADPRAIPLDDWQPPESCILVVGNETYGIAAHLRDRCDMLVCIPTYGFKASMNLSHALAIAGRHIITHEPG